jgi:hypothetical protein
MTYAEELACKMWLRHYDRWRADPARKMHELRKKPPGFDLWLQGDNPLGLELTQGTPSQLVPADWTSDAIPIPLPSEDLTQPSLL